MKNSSYIMVERNSRNEFRTNASFKLLGFPFKNVSVKIDTGCGYTTIPVQRIGLSKDEARELKYNDAQNDRIKKQISFGVNDSVEKKEKEKRLFQEKKFMDLYSVTFEHTMTELQIGNIIINEQSIRTSYDRTGNVLIGVDILEKMDIHIGESRVNGKQLFIACLKSNITQEYIKVLEEHFGLTSI